MPTPTQETDAPRRPRTRAEIEPLLRELKAALEDLYGERLAKLVLYGSFARGDATDASDIDVLVVLRGEVDRFQEIERISKVAYPLELTYEKAISTLPVSLAKYEHETSPLFENVQREGFLV